MITMQRSTLGCCQLTLAGLVLLGPAGQRGQAGCCGQQAHLAGTPPAQDAVDAVGGEQSGRFTTFAVGPLGAAFLGVLPAAAAATHGSSWIRTRAAGLGCSAPSPLPQPARLQRAPLSLPRTLRTLAVVTAPRAPGWLPLGSLCSTCGELRADWLLPGAGQGCTPQNQAWIPNPARSGQGRTDARTTTTGL